MFIALQVIDLDTNEVLGYVSPAGKYQTNLTGAMLFTKAKEQELIDYAFEFSERYPENRFYYAIGQKRLDPKAHPFVRLNLIEYKLEEVSNKMLVQVLVKDK